MNTSTFYEVSRGYKLLKVLGITAVIFLVLVGIAGATQDSDAWYNKGNALKHLNKSDEAIKAYDKAIEINFHNYIA
jgi:tetratricopeptide (TPR) repeat protein